MDSGLTTTARQLLDAAPCSVEMPAGTGKTHLLSAAVAEANARGERSLVLTHTNAGVDAIRKRLKAFGVPSDAIKVDTITGWAFRLVRAYSEIAGVAVPEIPNWPDAKIYVDGATNVAKAAAIVRVHALSFDRLFVDEYQDCTTDQHDLILALAAAIPPTVLLGDRMQAIFGFAGQLVSWDSDVLPRFPAFEVTAEPHRWMGHNEDLGLWLLDVRPGLVDGQAFDLSEHSVPGLTVVKDTTPAGLAAVAHGFSDFEETVVLLDKWPRTVAQHASRLGGTYSVMEDISGNFMREQLIGNPARAVAPLPDAGDPLLAYWFAQFAKECVIGLAGIDAVVLRRLARGESLMGLARGRIQPVVDALEDLRLNPDHATLAVAAQTIRTNAELRIYRWEAWTDTLQAIAMTAENAEPAIDNLGRVRERLRRQGRRNHARIASRTLLVKGLEYDHVIIADLSAFSDPRNLYVALSRGRKSVTILSSTTSIHLQND